ncbi:EAL domain-containing protein [Altererythrobacter salegens]|uniref:EAL domain-containing protein n=1 Tax=Croceibacterium salegens TaxID=1737568 RepID=A0A6I4SRX2_9SPHN|nr:bifunctional diguanylate cyclase/phosphodiesterase [Croceibacterium salegens]MXO58721.1 EAL domain-containing protein [Croceibacterium salegens]
MCRKSRIALSRIEGRAREVEAASRHCPVTGLPNRACANEWLNQALNERDGRPAVICAGFDPFGPGTDREATLVTRMSEIVAHIAPDGSLLARLAPGRYVIALGGALGTSELVTLARAACAMFGTLVSDSERLRVGVSIAVGSDTPESLIDRALEAQGAGVGPDPVILTFTDPEFYGEIEQRTAVARELESAIAGGRIEPFFQPFVELGSGRILGFEVLARWRDLEGRVRMPGEFLRLVEESGLVGRMYDSLLAAAAAEVRQWPPDWNFALNISASQLADEGLLERTMRTLLDAGVDPGRLEIEIAERALSANPEQARRLVDAFRKRGVKVSLDNFGSGSLHLRDLADFTFDRFKVDPTALSVDGGGDDGVAMGLIAAAARYLGVPVLAEGIETHACAEAAHVQGCDIGQGYLFGRPDRQTERFRLIGTLARPNDFAA